MLNSTLQRFFTREKRSNYRLSIPSIMTLLFVSISPTGLSQAEDVIYQLNRPTNSKGDVDRLAISPDGNRVVYCGDQDTDHVFELYSVLLEGGEVTKMKDPLDFKGNVGNYYKISPDSSRVVYITGQKDYGPFYLCALHDSSHKVSLTELAITGPKSVLENGIGIYKAIATWNDGIIKIVYPNWSEDSP